MQNKKNKKDSNRITFLIVIIILILLMVLWYLWSRQQHSQKANVTVTDTPVVKIEKDSLQDSIKVDSLKDTTTAIKTDTVVTIKKVVKKADSIVAKTDTIPVVYDTVKVDTVKAVDTVAKVVDPCESDTVKPWVYPDPSGGLHHGAIDIKFVATKQAATKWRYAGAKNWNDYDGETIHLDKTSTIEFTARDSCGNTMELRSEYYEITRDESEKNCPEGMEYVKVGDQSFCIDRYEWPNRKGVKPESFVSKYGASDSCFSKGKRLCTADEWSLACMGPYSWKYPYGQMYERYACSTHDTSYRVSGSKPECRSFFGVYDMSGNLAEWTDTKALENRQFYYVKGGFWESGPQSSCFDKRYSYYPQNKHNPVGFRCCSDVIKK